MLSGGGARAFAHIGVLEELTAAGVTIDRVAGVSMGAVIGALFAMGHDAEEIDAICFDEWVQRRPLRDFTIPRHSLIRGERVPVDAAPHVRRAPDRGTAAQLHVRQRRTPQRAAGIARHGPLWEAVGFSINLPVIAAPAGSWP